MFFKTSIFDINKGFDENFFLYFEETDYCRRSIKNNFKIYQINNKRVSHNIGSSVDKSFIDEKKLNNLFTWHFIWSKYYYYKKHYGTVFSIIFFVPILIRILFRIFLAVIINKKDIQEKYENRLSGLMSSIKGEKSYKRIN